MWQRWKYHKTISALFLLFMVLTYDFTFAQSIGRYCEGSQMPDGTYIPRGEVRIVNYGGQKYRCIGCGRCTPLSSGSAASSYSSRTYNYSPENFAQSLIMGLIQSFIDGFMKGLQRQSAPPARDYEAEMRRIQEEKWMAEWRKQVEEQIKSMQEEYKRLKEEEFRQSKHRLLSKLKGVEKKEPLESKRGGIALANLKCSYYWSKKASEEKNLEQAKIYNDYSAMAMNGEMACPEDAKIQFDIPIPSSDKSFREEFFEIFVVELNDRVNTALKLREELEKSSQKVKDAQDKIKELEAKKESAQKYEKEEIDSLLEEAKKALRDAIEQEKKARDSLETVNNEIKALQEIERTFLKLEAKK